MDASDPKAVHEAAKLNLATDKAYHLLDWRPTWSFEECIAETAQWYLAEAGDMDAGDLTRSQIASYQSTAAARNLAWATQ